MRVYIGKDYEEMSRIAANVLSAQVTMKPDCVLGLATGSTPIGTYKVLIDRCAKGDLDFSQVKSINLDEYVGLSGEHDQSYRYFMNHNLFDHINIDKANTNVPNGLAEDLDAECARYNEIINTLGPIDVQVLGMGHNGHIGFNEPSDIFELETHKVELAQTTIDANARFFANADEVPRQALTMGIKTIMQAKKVLVVANGKGKAEIVKKAFTGPVTPQVPASILQMHPDVVVVLDEEAASLL
ncbi:MAG: glucosamine-6-phosphate deaminase [Clostridium sp.]|nr:glucosamine-6-phosphate deaminase [Clostridium sp.]